MRRLRSVAKGIGAHVHDVEAAAAAAAVRAGRHHVDAVAAALQSAGDASECQQQLSPADIEQFGREGLLVLRGLLPAGECAALRRDVDDAVATGRRKAVGEADPHVPTEYPALGAVATFPPLLRALAALMPRGFAMQHLQCDRHGAGETGAPWHNDHTHSVTARPGLCVEAFIYPSRMDGTIGELLVLPGSQHAPLHRLALSPLFGTQDLPGSLCLRDAPEGTVVLLHAGLLHARRASPAGDTAGRYFIDVAYCETPADSNVRWPAYRYAPHGLQTMQRMNNAAARAAVRWKTTTHIAEGATTASDWQDLAPSLFDLSCFFDASTATPTEAAGRAAEASAEAYAARYDHWGGRPF
eukprot:COSAG01_NODE_10872_length_2065_cov_1.454730_1_plen_355_part_00